MTVEWYSDFYNEYSLYLFFSLSTTSVYLKIHTNCIWLKFMLVQMPFILNIYRITSYTPILSPKEHINVIYFYFLLLIHSFLFHIPNYHCTNESHSLNIFRITSFTWISHDHFKSRFYLFLIVSFTKRGAISNDMIVIFIIFKRLLSFLSICYHHFPLWNTFSSNTAQNR